MKFRLGFLLFMFSIGLIAQEQLSTKDLKVGLVLSGGGAKGMAHIGALKVIEEAGIRIDYIGGTSMGAIIGSLYASGYSAKQLDSIFQETNFNTLIQDELPRGVKSFYEKENAERYALTLPFQDFKLSFPSGLSQGQNLYNLLVQLMAPVDQIDDFSKLPVPFFCMGTNIETGEDVVLDRGSLPLAVSASGSLPSLFSPVQINGQLITDGGVTNNYPIEEIKKRGLDFVIGVDVQDSLVDRTELKTAFEIFNQINNFRTIKDMRSKSKETDLYIKPNISDFTILSFDRGREIIDQGATAAKNFEKELKEIAARQNTPPKPRKRIILQDSLTINNISIKGNSTYPRNYIRGKLKIDTEEKISYQELSTGINNLSASGNFKKIEYELVPLPDGTKNLNLIIFENNVNTLIRAALHYDELYKSAALVNLTQKSLILKNDILSLDLIAGDNFRYDFRYYIDKGSYWSIGLNSRYNRFEQDVDFSFIQNNFNIGDFNVNKVNIEYEDFTNQFYAETFIKKQFKMGLGFEHKYTGLKTETIVEMDNNEETPLTVLEKSNLFSGIIYLEYDRYNNAYFPSSGAHFYGDVHTYLFDSKTTFEFNYFAIAKGSAGYAFSISPKFAARLQTETGFRLGRNSVNSLDFFLGGYGNHFVNNIRPFLGYNFLEISGDSYIKGLVEVDYELFPKNHLVATYNFANVEDDLYQTGNFLSLPDFTGVALGYGLETFLGPMEIIYTYSPELSQGEFFFSLGFWF